MTKPEPLVEEAEPAHATYPTKPAPPATNRSRVYIGAVAAGILLLAGGFAAGVQYQKNHGTITTMSGRSGQNGFGVPGGEGDGDGPAGGFGGRMGRGSGGSVTAVSGSSITVKNPRSGASTTYSISASTIITKDGATASTSDIAAGDTVIVIPDSSNAESASRIIIGGFGRPGASSSGSSAPAN